MDAGKEMTQDTKDWIQVGCLGVIVLLRFAKWYWDYLWFSHIKKALDKRGIK
jgi:hypothetical protein